MKNKLYETMTTVCCHGLFRTILNFHSMNQQFSAYIWYNGVNSEELGKNVQ